MNKTIHRISEGNTNNYLIPGVFVMIPGLIFFGTGMAFGNYLLLGLGIFIAIVAILLFAGTNGLELNTESLSFRKYGKFGPMLIGDWEKLPKPLSVRIQVHAENGSRDLLLGGAIPGRAATVNTKVVTYDLVIVDRKGQGHILYSFLKYKNAKESMAVIAGAFEVEARDLIAEKIAENRSRRR